MAKTLANYNQEKSKQSKQSRYLTLGKRNRNVISQSKLLQVIMLL